MYCQLSDNSGSIFENGEGIMKTIAIISFFCFLFFIPSARAQTRDNNEKIALAIRAGNAKELAKHFSKNIDLNIPGSEGVYSKTQAELIMKEFFSMYKTISFSTLHQGSSKDGAKYTIGNLKTDKGIFRLYYYMKKTSDVYYIHEFSLNEEDKD
ncbi:MAG: hypothetical protein COB85_00665 [Bacteroidetes bacterium]|nr:MAG: hypothetical protein COB85_00665 [Bacteroidota bacterium]